MLFETLLADFVLAPKSVKYYTANIFKPSLVPFHSSLRATAVERCRSTFIII